MTRLEWNRRPDVPKSRRSPSMIGRRKAIPVLHSGQYVTVTGSPPIRSLTISCHIRMRTGYALTSPLSSTESTGSWATSHPTSPGSTNAGSSIGGIPSGGGPPGTISSVSTVAGPGGRPPSSPRVSLRRSGRDGVTTPVRSFSGARSVPAVSTATMTPPASARPATRTMRPVVMFMRARPSFRAPFPPSCALPKPLAVREEPVLLPSLPGLPEAVSGQVPVGTDLLEQLPEVPAEILHRRSAPVPIAVVHPEDPQARLQDQGERDHRVVVGIGVLLDVEVLLDLPAWVGEERPLRPERVAELVGLHEVVGGDGDDPGVPHPELGIEIDVVPKLAAVLGAEVAPGKHQDHGIASLELRQPSAGAGLVRQLVVREHGPGPDVTSHLGSPPREDLQIVYPGEPAPPSRTSRTVMRSTLLGLGVLPHRRDGPITLTPELGRPGGPHGHRHPSPARGTADQSTAVPRHQPVLARSVPGRSGHPRPWGSSDRPDTP